MAESLVSPLLEQITTIATQQVQEEVTLVVGVEEEVEKLTSNLSAIQAVLEDAERRQLKEAVVRDWINKLKQLVYDIDDVLDEWSTAILKRQTHEEAENQAVSKKMVCSFLPSPCSCFQKVIHRRDIALKIKKVSERLDVIAKEKARYRFESDKGIEETERLIMDGNDLEESYTATSYERVRHSTVELSSQGHFPVSIYKAKNLRSLLMINATNPSLGATLPDLFKQLTCLRSLDLSRSSIQEIPIEVVKLIHLRYLDLSYCRKLKSLPETICDLCNLQSLAVSWCDSIKELPQATGKLTKLRHLMVDYSGVAFIPKGIERLSSLRTLDRFPVCSDGENASKAANLGELKNLNQLRGSLWIEKLGNMVDVSEAEKAELKNKKHLQRLALWFDGEKTELRANEEALIEALQPPSDLDVLHIEDYSGIFLPNWIMSLTRLTKLELVDCGNFEVLPPLGRLPNLEYLELMGLKQRRLDVGFLGIENVDKAYINEGELARVPAFPKLKQLKIWYLEELEEWDDWIERRVGEKDATTSIIMRQLQELRISDCPILKLEDLEPRL
ncbi:unnamed protein product [Dovyalis caffra]|uniref:Rx N-terminal domain-containing protein n=1 Tax=Dovyalis caffra TaxID=77055 RepID=A0AAV1RKM4_9ROSI|nr:unnamed protein product [Dovyalis caffra]